MGIPLQGGLMTWFGTDGPLLGKVTCSTEMRERGVEHPTRQLSTNVKLFDCLAAGSLIRAEANRPDQRWSCRS